MFSGLPYCKNQTQYSNKTQLKKLKLKPKQTKPNTSLSSHPHTYFHQKNINDQLMQQHQRKQNYLNSKYNQRVGQLKKITNDNKKIYERINSQKSLYSQKDQRKSYDSLRSLSRCSSRSKDDKRQSKRNTYGSFKVVNKPKTNKGKMDVTIQSESINKVNDSNLKDFQRMFKHNQQNSKGLANRQMRNQKQNRSFSLRVEKKSSQGMGNMLHKIAEQMNYNTNSNRTKYLRKVLY